MCNKRHMIQCYSTICTRTIYKACYTYTACVHGCVLGVLNSCIISKLCELVCK